VHKGTEGEGAAPTGPGPQLPGSLKTQPMLDGWIRIGPDGTATLFTGKAELGQGIKTALIQVAAEELVRRRGDRLARRRLDGGDGARRRAVREPHALIVSMS